VFQLAANRSIRSMSSLTEPTLPRRIAPRERIPNHVSTWFIQDAEVGVRWNTNRHIQGWRGPGLSKTGGGSVGNAAGAHVGRHPADARPVDDAITALGDSGRLVWLHQEASWPDSVDPHPDKRESRLPDSQRRSTGRITLSGSPGNVSTLRVADSELIEYFDNSTFEEVLRYAPSTAGKCSSASISPYQALSDPSAIASVASGSTGEPPDQTRTSGGVGGDGVTPSPCPIPLNPAGSSPNSVADRTGVVVLTWWAAQNGNAVSARTRGQRRHGAKPSA
jgi:hypothetical protein